MTRAAKFTYLAALLIGLSVGAFVGFRSAASELALYYEGLQTISPSALGDFTLLQYQHADGDHATHALLSYADLLQEMEKLKPDMAQKRELAYTYVRLALLQDAANDTDQSCSYMAQAQQWWKATHGPDHSDSEMKNGIRTRDEQLQRFNIPW